jgi:hypothetical protein
MELERVLDSPSVNQIIQDLSVVFINNVFKNLDILQILTMSLVSTQFNKISNDPIVWKHVFNSYAEHGKLWELFAAILNIDVNNHKELISKTIPFLEKRITEEGIAKLAQEFKYFGKPVDIWPSIKLLKINCKHYINPIFIKIHEINRVMRIIKLSEELNLINKLTSVNCIPIGPLTNSLYDFVINENDANSRYFTYNEHITETHQTHQNALAKIINKKNPELTKQLENCRPLHVFCNDRKLIPIHEIFSSFFCTPIQIPENYTPEMNRSILYDWHLSHEINYAKLPNSQYLLDAGFFTLSALSYVWLEPHVRQIAESCGLLENKKA